MPVPKEEGMATKNTKRHKKNTEEGVRSDQEEREFFILFSCSFLWLFVFFVAIPLLQPA